MKTAAKPDQGAIWARATEEERAARQKLGDTLGYASDDQPAVADGPEFWAAVEKRAVAAGAVALP